MSGTETEGSTTDTQQTMGESGAVRAFVLNTKPLFKLMVEKKASDLFFTSNAPIKIKIEGQIKPINRQVLTAEQVKRLDDASAFDVGYPYAFMHQIQQTW